MTSKELKSLLPDDDTPIFVHAASLGAGCDVYAPLDDIEKVAEGISFGSTSNLYGSELILINGIIGINS